MTVWRLASVVIALAGFAASAPIRWQAHSFDDLREWPQLFSKANHADNIFVKVDPQWLPASMCASQSRANASDPRGCLVLNHDAVTPTSRGSMNTTSDLLAFIASPEHAVWFASPASRVTISLCFKGCGGATCPCSDDPATASWLSLVDDFVAGANSAVTSRNLNVEFVLDGAGNPGSAICLASRWRPWRSVFITGDDPAGAYTANNASLGWDRLVILNQPLDLWPSTVASGYGKFVSSAAPFPNYPFLIWEPSDQPSLIAAANLFQNSSAGGAGPSSHAAGLRFAINIDPAQAEVYLAPAADVGSATAWNNELVPSTTARLPAVASVQLSHRDNSLLLASSWIDVASGPMAPGGHGYGSGHELVVAVWAVPGSAPGSTLLPVINATVVSTTGVVPDPSAPAAGSLRPCLAAVTVLESTSNSTLLLASTLTASAAAIAVDTFELIVGSTEGLTPAGSVLLPLPTATIGFATGVASCSNGSAAVLCVAVSYLPADAASHCALYLVLYTIATARREVADSSSTASSWIATVAAAPVCVVAATAATEANVSAAAVSAGGLSVSLVEYSSPVDGSPALAVAMSYSANGTIFGATACASIVATSVAATVVNDPLTCFGSSSPGRPRGGDTPAPGTVEPLINHVGSQPGVTVQALQAGGGLPSALSLLLLESHSNGYCPNSETHNKEADVGLCDQVPLRNAGGAYVNYNAGPLHAWAWQLLQRDDRPMSDASSWPGASPCSLTMAHGMVDMGAHPAPLLLTAATAPPSVFAVLVLEGAGTAGVGVADPLLCGAANNATGLRLDGWQLPTAIMTGGALPPRS